MLDDPFLSPTTSLLMLTLLTMSFLLHTPVRQCRLEGLLCGTSDPRLVTPRSVKNFDPLGGWREV